MHELQMFDKLCALKSYLDFEKEKESYKRVLQKHKTRATNPKLHGDTSSR